MISSQRPDAPRADTSKKGKTGKSTPSLLSIPNKVKASFSKSKNSTDTTDMEPDVDSDPANQAPGIVRQNGSEPPPGLEGETSAAAGRSTTTTTTASATSPGGSSTPVVNRQGSTRGVVAQAQGTGTAPATAPAAGAVVAPPRPTGPLVPGLPGLYNIGNTCFMNSALNCLLHTPLLSGYLISGKYIADINRDNRLGTGGRLTEELARLFNELWSSRLKPVSPASFKKCLEVTKPIFSGNDQHDAQEFLVELIDTIHEDLNDRAGGVSRAGKAAMSQNGPVRAGSQANVVHQSSITLDFASEVNNDILLQSPDAISSAELKPIRPEFTFEVMGPSLDSDIASRMTSEELAKYYWDRHLSRNSSVMVNLVQGQMRSEVECPACTTVTQTFDPFSCVSVPIPKQHHERQIVVVLFRRMPWLMNAFKTNKMLVSSRIMSINDLTEAYVKIHRMRRRARRSCVTLSRLNEVCDLKQSICDDYNQEQAGEGGTGAGATTGRDSLSGNAAADSGQLVTKQLLLCEYKNSKLCKALEDRNPVANLEMLVNPENPMSLCCFSFEANIDVPFISAAPAEMLSGRHAASSVSSRPISSSADKGSMVTDAWFKLRDREDYESGVSTTTSGRTVVDVTDETLPTDYAALLELVKKAGPYAVRLDAMDKKGKWFSGSIVTCSLRANRETYDPVDYEIAVRNAKVLVHFDYFSSKWDEVMSMSDFKNGRMAPLYSRCRRKIAVFEVRVVLRYPVSEYVPEEPEAAPAIPVASDAPITPRSKNRALDALNPSKPFAATSKPPIPAPAVNPKPKAVDATASTVFEPEVAQTFVLQLESFRSCENAYRNIVDQVASRYLSEDEIRAYLKESLAGAGPSVADARLPFDVRMVTSSSVKAPGQDIAHGYTWGTQQLFNEDNKAAWDGTLFPRDDKRPLCNVYHNKFVVTVDWKAARRRPFVSTEGTAAPSNTKAFAEYRDTPSYLTAIRNAKPLPVRPPAPANNTLASTSSSTSPSSSSATSLPTSPVVDMNEVSLMDCLRSYSCDEVLDEGTWFCSMCQTHRRGTMRPSFYRLPDILILHVKRFNMTARWREKIRTKVAFPIDGLDMNDFLTGPNSSKNRGAIVPSADGTTDLSESTSDRDENIYDLYSVINHLGGMSGGHYTAAVRYYGYPTDAEAQSSPPVRQSNPSTAANAKGSNTGNDSTGTAGTEQGKKGGFLSGLLCRGSFSDVLKGNVSELGAKVHKHLTPQQRKQVDASIGQWFLVDDDIVTAVDEDKVVSPNAYVLFYRRRKLSPGNVQSMSAPA